MALHLHAKHIPFFFMSFAISHVLKNVFHSHIKTENRLRSKPTRVQLSMSLLTKSTVQSGGGKTYSSAAMCRVVLSMIEKGTIVATNDPATQSVRRYKCIAKVPVHSGSNRRHSAKEIGKKEQEPLKKSTRSVPSTYMTAFALLKSDENGDKESDHTCAGLFDADGHLVLEGNVAFECIEDCFERNKVYL